MAYKKSKFFTPRTAGFLNKIAREYVSDMGQSVLYYKVDAEKSDFKDDYERLFRESRKKYYREPVELECSVYIDKKNTESFNDVAYELRTFIDVFVERELLKKHGIEPTIGDVISFQGLFFQVFDTDDSKMYHGNPNYKFAVEINALDIRINNNENLIKSDKDYYYEDLNRKNPFPMPSISDDAIEVLYDVDLIDDDLSVTNSYYTDNFQTLNVDLKRKIESDDIPTLLNIDNSDLLFVYGKSKRKTKIDVDLSTNLESNNITIEQENGEYYLSMSFSYNVDSKDFKDVDRLFFDFKDDGDIHNFYAYRFEADSVVIVNNVPLGINVQSPSRVIAEWDNGYIVPASLDYEIGINDIVVSLNPIVSINVNGFTLTLNDPVIDSEVNETVSVDTENIVLGINDIIVSDPINVFVTPSTEIYSISIHDDIIVRNSTIQTVDTDEFSLNVVEPSIEVRFDEVVNVDTENIIIGFLTSQVSDTSNTFILPSTDELSITINDSVVSGDSNVGSNEINLEIIDHTPIVSTQVNTTVEANVEEIVIEINNITIFDPDNTIISALTESLSIDVNNIEVSGDSNVFSDVNGLEITEHTPQIVTGITISVDSQSLEIGINQSQVEDTSNTFVQPSTENLELTFEDDSIISSVDVVNNVENFIVTIDNIEPSVLNDIIVPIGSESFDMTVEDVTVVVQTSEDEIVIVGSNTLEIFDIMPTVLNDIIVPTTSENMDITIEDVIVITDVIVSIDSNNFEIGINTPTISTTEDIDQINIVSNWDANENTIEHNNVTFEPQTINLEIVDNDVSIPEGTTVQVTNNELSIGVIDPSVNNEFSEIVNVNTDSLDISLIQPNIISGNTIGIDESINFEITVHDAGVQSTDNLDSVAMQSNWDANENTVEYNNVVFESEIMNLEITDNDVVIVSDAIEIVNVSVNNLEIIDNSVTVTNDNNVVFIAQNESLDMTDVTIDGVVITTDWSETWEFTTE